MDHYDKLLVASEYTEVSQYWSKAATMLEYHKNSAGGRKAKVGLLLITKDLYGCIELLCEVRRMNIPVVVHATLTGFAGTIMEPNIDPNWRRQIEAAAYVVSKDTISAPQTLANSVVIRVDPLIPYYTTTVTLLTIAEEMHKAKLTRARISILDYYPHVRKRFDDWSLDHPDQFQAADLRKGRMLREACEVFGKYGITVESCAETDDSLNPDKPQHKPNMPILHHIGCATAREWEKYGINLAKQKIGTMQRGTCLCDVQKTDIMPKDLGCPLKCLYCYWRKE